MVNHRTVVVESRATLQTHFGSFYALRLRLFAFALLLVGSLGCAPALRFDPATQAALAKSDMQRLETEHVTLYYGADRREEAMRVATRYDACIKRLRLRTQVTTTGFSQEKPRIVLPDAPLNNAYVAPMAAGFEPMGVVPTYNTSDIFALLGIAPDPSYIGCHELTHYIHSNQIHGLPNAINFVFGNVLTPQVGLNAWFWEGIAVYYETRLQGGSGRQGSPLWRGLFAAGMHDTRVNGGTLQEFTREVPFGGHYLVGSHFIDYLVRTYGEEKLWKVIYNQGDSFFFLLGVNPRFGNVYGKNLSDLIDEFASDVQREFPKTERPAEQRVIRDAGFYARYTCHAGGAEATVTSGLDEPPRIVVHDAKGNVVSDRTLVDVLPPRKLRTASPNEISGVSFNQKGDAVYFTSVDQGDVQQVARLMRYEVASGGLEEIAPDITGSGGSISPDESGYYFSRALGDEAGLARFDMRTHETTVLKRFGPRTYIIGPRISPDGKRIVATFFDGVSFRIALFDASGNYLEDIDPPEGLPSSPGGGLARAPKIEPQWMDASRVTYTAEAQGRFQVFVADVDKHTRVRISRAPYLASSPCGSGNRLRFLNRYQWQWSLDEVALAPATERPAEAPALSSLGISNALDAREAVRDEAPIVVDDRPYSRLEHLFVPQIRYPSLQLIATYGTVLGAGAGGGDRLGFHRWQVDGLINLKNGFGGAQAAYLMSELAPWFVLAQGVYRASLDHPAYDRNQLNLDLGRPIAGNADDVRRYEAAAQVLVQRPVDTNVATAGLVFDQLIERGVSYDKRRVGGVMAGFTYQGVEFTSYSGVRRAVIASVNGAFFPKGTSTLPTNTEDVRGELILVTPLPISKRHTLTLDARTRHVLGRVADAAPLQIGGNGQSSAGSSADVSDQRQDLPLPPTFQFFEALRGFEDRAFYGSRVGVAELRYQYPLIFDVGSASSLWLFPRSYMSELDFELFGTAATFYDRTTPPVAVGGAVTLRMLLLGLPLSTHVQVMRRLTYDQHWVPVFGLGGPL